MKKLIIIILILVGCLLIPSASLMAQDQGPPFPRIGVFHWGGAQTDWYANFDLVITFNTGNNFARSIHKINPDSIVLPTRDWNIGEGMKIPDEWYLRDSKGKKVRAYANVGYLINITEFCPKAETKYGMLNYNEFLSISAAKLVDLSVYDGIATSGLWPYPWGKENVDLDGNGINDRVEEGKGTLWVRKQWNKGIEKMLSNLRNRIGNNNVIHINSGQFHSFGWSKTNGMTFEHSRVTYAVNWSLNRFKKWRSVAPYPHTILDDAKGDNKNDFSTMRYHLGSALMYDAYFSYSDSASGEHHYDHYYDEFDVDLGYPKGDVQQLKEGNGGIAEQGIWVKFYDKGVVIINLDHKDNSVNDTEIQHMGGYDGPYYRFKGGQDPEFNDGEKFTQVILKGTLKDENPLGFVGDAIILLKKPKTIVADIIIDNVKAGTSPASQSAQLKGEWINIPINHTSYNGRYNKKAWGVGARPYAGIYAYAQTKNKKSSASAHFIPTIGVAGMYEVFEWHGAVDKHYQTDNGIQADPGVIQKSINVPVTIKYANGEVNKYIDQSKKEAQWNSLGTYYFKKGTDGKVIISNQNTNGQVVADAVKFVYNGIVPLKADFNCDNKVDIQDFAILLSHWGETRENLNQYQHPKCKQQEDLGLPKRNLKLSNNSTSLGVYDLGVFLGCWGNPEKQSCYLIE